MYEQHETGDPQLGKEKEDKMDKRTKELVVVGVVVIIAMMNNEVLIKVFNVVLYLTFF